MNPHVFSPGCFSFSICVLESNAVLDCASYMQCLCKYTLKSLHGCQPDARLQIGLVVHAGKLCPEGSEIDAFLYYRVSFIGELSWKS